LSTKKTTKKPTNSAPSPFKGFINFNLNEDDKATIKATTLTSDEFVALLDQFADDGFKLTLSYDDYSQCYQCIGTRKDTEHPDYGVMLTGRGSTAMKAFKQWWYIVVNLIGESSWVDWLKPNTRYEIDD